MSNPKKHLGHIFKNSYNIINIDSSIRDIKVRSNIILNKFRSVSWKSKVLLFNNQCSSLYGCPLWRLDNEYIDRLYIDWNICCRKVLGLHPRTRTYLLHQVMDNLPIKYIIMNRILIFFITGIKHQNTLISNFFRNVLIANSSHMLTNVNTILKFLDVKHNDLLELNKYQTKKLLQAKIEKPDWRCDFIQELLTINDGQLFVDMDQSSTKQLQDYVSTFR